MPMVERTSLDCDTQCLEKATLYSMNSYACSEITTIARGSLRSREWLGKVLAPAQKLMARDPRLAAWLLATGLGDHPQVIKLAIQKSRR